MALRERAQQHDVPVRVEQRERILVGESRIGFVHDQQAVERAGELAQTLWRGRGAGRTIGICHKCDGAPGVDQSLDWERKVVGERHLDHRCVLNVRQCSVQHVGWRGVDDGPSGAGGRAHEDREEVVAAVSSQHPARVDADHTGGGTAELIPQRMRIPTELVRVECTEGLEGFGARRVRVLVRVQFDRPRAARRLTARNIGTQGVDGGTEEGHEKLGR